MPQLVSVYDIENAEFYENVAQALLPEYVYITEKLEGSNWGLTAYRDGRTVVSTRRHAVEPIEGKEHDWARAAREADLFAKALLLVNDLGAQECVSFRGELIGSGVQGNYYELRGLHVYLFEIEVDGKAITAQQFLTLCTEYSLQTVPVLCAGEQTLASWLGNQTLPQASNGKSVINPGKAREGIVIRPFSVEQWNSQVGRLILKQRSPVFLAGSDF
jgi:hypothetical protein